MSHKPNRDTPFFSNAPPRIRLAYLVNPLSMLSHASMMSEIAILEQRGLDITPLTITTLNHSQTHYGYEKQSRFHLNQRSYIQLPRAIINLRHDPRGLLRALWLTLCLGKGNLGQHWRQLTYLAKAILLAEAMQQHDCRHLHMRLAKPVADIGILVQALHSCGLSFTMHGNDEFAETKSLQIQAKVAQADFVICISQFCRSQLMLHSQHADWHKLKVVPLAVKSVQPPARSKVEGLHLVTIGPLTPAKGQLLLLQAFAQLQHWYPKATLSIIGSGPLQAVLAQAIHDLKLENSVRLLGDLPHDAAMQVLEQADIFVLPSLLEGAPIILMEAMMRAIPCVASYLASIPELIEDRISGWLVPAGDQHSLQEALRQLAQNRSLRQRLGCAGRERVLNHYQLENHADLLAAIFHAELTPQEPQHYA
ncbi:glycosyltransferase family 4 protein [Neisseriaceae bacterium TC5R-5]|nr:glycosyltransferase family 4 protein [Neisseriaceae bacterium TC5R-5]